MEVISLQNELYNNTEEYEYELPVTEQSALIETLSRRLEVELRAAKRTHFSVGEVLLPNGLTRRIAEDILNLADSEPCGLRGCTLYISFESDEVNRKLSTIQCDPNTPSTFEVYLTLRQSAAGWNAFLPEFIKKITKSGTVMISNDYGLQKKKLYRPTC